MSNNRTPILILLTMICSLVILPGMNAQDATYALVDTGQGFCYNDNGENIDCPAEGKAFYG